MDAELDQQLSSIVEQERELGASTEAQQLEDVVEEAGPVDPVGEAPDAEPGPSETSGPTIGEEANQLSDQDREEFQGSGDPERDGQISAVLEEERGLGASTEAGQLEDVVKG